LIPETTFDSFDNPVSTAWSSAGETTKVKVTWQKVDIASGYVISRQQLDNSGAPIGAQYIEATLEGYPYVDQNASILAPAELSHLADVKWDEHWEGIKVLSVPERMIPPRDQHPDLTRCPVMQLPDMSSALLFQSRQDPNR
jgi:hypothetical protein